VTGGQVRAAGVERLEVAVFAELIDCRLKKQA